MIQRVLKSYLILKQCTKTTMLEKLAGRDLFYNLSLKQPEIFARNVSYKSGEQTKEATIANIMKDWQEKFEKEKINEPVESIQFITAHVLGIKKIPDLLCEQQKELTNDQLITLETLCECRLSRMPVQYIIGEWDFRDITLKMEPPIFIPRPETETLVDVFLQKLDAKNGKSKVLEIGCGSGAICLSILHSRNDISVIAIDTNPQACELTLRNAKDLGYQDRLVLLNSSIKEDGTIEIHKEYNGKHPIKLNEEKFDFILSNPPYVATETIFRLQPEVKLFEDIQALDGGKEGLNLIEAILKYASEAVTIGGSVIMEIDCNHPDRIQGFIEEHYKNKLKFEQVHQDYCDKDRIVEISRIG